MTRFVLAVLVAFLALSTPTMTLAAVDINTANEAQLESLPGIGPGKAKAIVAERQANGPFKSVDELRRVKGIGEKTIAELRAQASVGPPPPTSGTAAVNRKSPAPADGFPWGWVVLIVVAAGAAGWFFLRRRSAAPIEAAAPGQYRESSAPIAPGPVPTPAPAPSGAVPKPAGPSPAAAPAAKAAPIAATSAPPAPAGPKPAGQPAPAPASAPPPAPAGPERTDA